MLIRVPGVLNHGNCSCSHAHFARAAEPGTTGADATASIDKRCICWDLTLDPGPFLAHRAQVSPRCAHLQFSPVDSGVLAKCTREHKQSQCSQQHS